MIKIVLNDSALEVMLNCINVCNILNANQYPCVVYGLKDTLRKSCKSMDVSQFLLEDNDIIFLDNIRFRDKKSINYLSLLLNPKEYKLKKNRFKYRVKRWFARYRDNIEYFFKPVIVKNFKVFNSDVIPVVDMTGKNIDKAGNTAGIFSTIEKASNIDLALNQALKDGMKEVYLFGFMQDPVYYYNVIRPMIEKSDGKIKYAGYHPNKNMMYENISDIYEFSNNRKMPYFEMECANNYLEFHSNNPLTYNKKTTDEIIDLLNISTKKISDITVVLNGFRRGYNLKDQMKALENQTVKADAIMLWYNNPSNGSKINYRVAAMTQSAVSNINWGVWARFYYALNAKTKYICIFDDDTIPGERWLENCLNTIKTHQGLLGTIGLIFNDPNDYYNNTRYGWANPNEEVKQVDIVGHSWFFERESLTAFCRELPLLDVKICGEDIHFSYTLQKYFQLNTYVPPHPKDDKSMWGSLNGWKLGMDEHAISRQHVVNRVNSFVLGVNDYYKECQQNGWKLIKFKDSK